MNAHLILTVSSIAFLTLSHFASTEKSPFIRGCKADQLVNGFYRHLTFICDIATVMHNDCTFDVDYSNSSLNSFHKSGIRKIGFENCAQPTISNTIFRKYPNVNDLDMSHLRMTMDQMRFFAEPNKLTQIDLSYNNITAISNGGCHKYNI